MKLFQRGEYKPREKGNKQCAVFKEPETVCSHHSIKCEAGTAEDDVSHGP